MIEQPPKIKESFWPKAAALAQRDDIRQLLIDANDEYWYWTDAKYKPRPDGVGAEELWGTIKFSRIAQRQNLWKKYGLWVSVTNRMQQMCHNFDLSFAGTGETSIPTEERARYVVSSLMEEAISSSQMEGASTTRKVAKDMLRKNVSPRSRSEQMIFNNYASIRYIAEHKDDNLTSEMLLHIHSLMTNKTLANAEDEGRYRTDDGVVVENSITHEVVHTPPSHTEIPEFVADLCAFANSNEDGVFFHPIIKAIAIHYMVAYVHPFVDGNGRTARALFYWYMLKKGYWLTEFLSISRVIYRSKASYEKSYLYSESDDGDMGYFIAYNLRVLDLAYKEFQTYLELKSRQSRDNTELILHNGVNERQAAILSWVRVNPQIVLTVKEVETRFGVSQPTARLDLDGLVAKGMLKKIPVNKVKNNYIKGDEFDSLISDKTPQGE